jgi:hypothetical protein
MENRTADLGMYIENCHYGDSLPFFSRDQVFDRGLTHRPPRLESTRTNRILLYPGSFNPPHHSHLALLQHIYGSSQDDINVLAAIILPLGDDCIERKCRAAGEDLVLTKDQRVRLWRGEFGPNGWYWVYDRSREDWDSFRNRLADAITQDGFDLKFAVLCGPDYVKRTSPPPWKAWDCDEIIVSDVSRFANFTTLDGTCTLCQLKDCEPWGCVAYDKEDASRRAKETASWLVSGLSLLSPSMLKEKLKASEILKRHNLR